MKPLYRKVPVKLEKSFNIRRDIKSHLTGVGHYHPELELHYVIKGEGVRFIGDTRSGFSAGEMVLVGANLPHAWKSPDHSELDPSNEFDVIVANFAPEFLGKQFLQLPESINLNKLLDRAKIGLEFFGPTRDRIADLLLTISQAEGFDRIVLFLQVLNLLAVSDDCKPIVNGKHMLFQPNDFDARRLNMITDYTLSHYRREISLEEIASVCNLSTTSFCRYFKAMTAKTYVDFLNEIRVSNACKMLIEDRLPAEAICLDSGFQNVSNFYRRFKKVTGMTPQKYRKKCLLSTSRSPGNELITNHVYNR